MLSTLLRPTAGFAQVLGCDVLQHAHAVRAQIGYPQLLSADSALTGYQNLLLSSPLYLVPRRERAGRITAALKMTSLTESAHRRPLSGGARRHLKPRARVKAAISYEDSDYYHVMDEVEAFV